MLNAANEVAVAAFLSGRIGFLDIAAIVEEVLSGYSAPTPRSIAEILEADGAARHAASRIVERVQV